MFFILVLGLRRVLLRNFFLQFNINLLVEVDLVNWGVLTAPFILLIDKWRVFFSLTVLLISRSVFVFSYSYIAHEVYSIRFHVILRLFIFSILILIFSPGFISLFLGWDGLGLRSFLLVIYYRNIKSLNAGILTFLTNRLGDGLLLVGAATGFWALQFNLFLVTSSLVSRLLLCLLIGGAITKRAQVPFRAWLPAAMAAPTPVSSLVHSSTLVTAGIYLLFRLFDLFTRSILRGLLILGILTITLARLRALQETDIKKIVALSTLSQLGLIVVALGIGQPYLRFFHLITHAFFKAIIFVAVGTIIHIENSYQDLKVIGKRASHPLVLGVLRGANFSLRGLPFFSGFFRKEAIIQISLRGASSVSLGTYLIFVLRIFLTQLYRIRFFIKVRLLAINYKILNNFGDEGNNTINSILILFFPALITGSLLRHSWGLLFQVTLDPRAVKIFLVSRIIFRLIIRNSFFKRIALTPQNWIWGNIWFLPWFSGALNRKFLKAQEIVKTYFQINFLDLQVVKFNTYLFLEFKKANQLLKLTFFEITSLRLLLIIILII